jgi:hypothetical protein
MHSIEYNLALLKEMMEEFEAHILSKELFWPLRKNSYNNIPFPRLSIGALLLTLDELEALLPEMDPPEEHAYREQLNSYERFSQQFRVAIENKTARELITRTNLWRGFLQDLEEDPESADEYVRQVRNRVLMKKLGVLTSMDQAESEADTLRGLDEWMLLDALPVEFIWDKRLEPIYPIEEFPFLYLKPR